MTAPLGRCAVVLHSHLPWVAHHGAWPVGEEWLHQAWATSYSPMVAMLERLADQGREQVLTLGVTPVLAAMLDDPYCLTEQHTWLGTWAARAEGASVRGVGTAAYEGQLARTALERFESGWVHGGSPLLARLAASGVVELLGGPATHPFLPLAHPRVAAAQLRTGLDDARIRFGRQPRGIWAPECGYTPGLEQVHRHAGVGHFLVDGPTVGGRTGHGYDVAGSGVVAFARDLQVTYRVWSPRSGYPGGKWYRDFHTFDHDSGLRPARVTSRRTPPESKAPYDPARAALAVERDAQDFAATVVQRLTALREERDGRPGLVVVAYDTELFGHWWHEGPAWLERVLELLPQAGVELTTLAGAVDAGHVEEAADLPAGSWGAGKDWHVWEGAAVTDLVEAAAEVDTRLLKVVDGHRGQGRDDALDQLTREAFLANSSDWAFLVTHDSSADYARRRAAEHTDRFHRLADAIRAGRPTGELVAALRRTDGPFGHLDARVVAGAPDTMVRSCAS